MHHTALQPQANLTGSSCHPLPCGRPSRPPWWGVTPTTTMVALSPSSLRKEGDPVVRHDETTVTGRQSTHPQSPPHWSVPSARKVGNVSWEGVPRAGQRFQTIAAGSGIAPHGDWTSSSLALAIGHGSCGALPSVSSSAVLRFPSMLFSPLAFASRWAGRPKNPPSSSSWLGQGFHRAPHGAPNCPKCTRTCEQGLWHFQRCPSRLGWLTKAWQVQKAPSSQLRWAT
jgi:hypothetical protein